MNIKFASAIYTAGQLNAMVKLLKKQGGEDGPGRFLRGEITVSKPPRAWYEQDGIIYFSVTSDGATGENWIKRLESKNFCISDYAKSVLRSSNFKPTDGVTYEIAVLKGMLFSDNDRVMEKIRAEADKRKLTKPNVEVACLMREKLTDEEIEAMGLWWIAAMHESINDSDGDPRLLSVRRGAGGKLLGASSNYSGGRWSHECGFAFVVPRE